MTGSFYCVQVFLSERELIAVSTAFFAGHSSGQLGQQIFSSQNNSFREPCKNSLTSAGECFVSNVCSNFFGIGHP